MKSWRADKPETARIADLVEDRILALGLKQTPLSHEISGHEKTVANLFSGRSPNPEILGKLARRLGLEFYFGPPRHNVAIGETPNPGVLGPADVRDVHTDTTPEGRVWLEIEVGPLGTAQMMLTPGEAKALSASLAHRALEIEEKKG